MFNCKSNIERYNHDSQTIYKEITDNFITKYVDFKLYV
jgi:hypothetical protein